MSQCKAKYGGAIYAFSDKEENEIKIVSCKFEKCEALIQPSESGSVLYGGSAIYMHVKNGAVNDCIFINNIGNIIKVNNNFDDSAKHLMNLIETSFSINNCVFETSKPSSSSSLYYIRGDQHEIQFEVKNCVFKGELLNGTHYIDGVKLGNKKDRSSKLRIESCKFSDMRNAMNTKKLGLHIKEFNNNSQQIYFNESENRIINKMKLICAITFTASFTIIAISIILVIRKNNFINDISNDQKEP